MPENFFSCIENVDDSVPINMGIIAKVSALCAQEDELIQLYKLLTQDAKKALLSKLLTEHSAELSSELLTYCVRNWSEGVAVQAVLTATAVASGEHHPLIGFLSSYGASILWDEDLLNKLYSLVPSQQHLALVQAVAQYHENILVYGYDTEEHKVLLVDLSSDGVFDSSGDEKFSTEIAGKMLRCSTSLAWMPVAYRSALLCVLWTLQAQTGMKKNDFYDLLAQQFYVLNDFDMRLSFLSELMSRNPHKVNHIPLAWPIAYDDFLTLLNAVRTDADPLNMALIIKHIADECCIHLSDDEATFFLNKFFSETINMLSPEFQGIMLLHLADRVLVSENSAALVALLSYAQAFKQELESNDARLKKQYKGYFDTLEKVRTQNNLADFVKPLPTLGIMKRPHQGITALVQDINGCQNMEEAYALLMSSLVRMLHDASDTSNDRQIFIKKCFFLACHESPLSLAYEPYQLAFQSNHGLQDSVSVADDETKSQTSRVSGFSIYSARTAKTTATKKTNITSVSQGPGMHANPNKRAAGIGEINPRPSKK